MAPAVLSTHEGLSFPLSISFCSQCVALRGNIIKYEFLILALFAFRMRFCAIQHDQYTLGSGVDPRPVTMHPVATSFMLECKTLLSLGVTVHEYR